MKLLPILLACAVAACSAEFDSETPAVRLRVQQYMTLRVVDYAAPPSRAVDLSAIGAATLSPPDLFTSVGDNGANLTVSTLGTLESETIARIEEACELVEWPSGTLVPTDASYVEAPSADGLSAHRFEFRPRQPLRARWYGFACAVATGDEAAGLVHLSDGRVVTRFRPDSHAVVRMAQRRDQADRTLLNIVLSERVRFDQEGARFDIGGLPASCRLAEPVERQPQVPSEAEMEVQPEGRSRLTFECDPAQGRRITVAFAPTVTTIFGGPLHGTDDRAPAVVRFEPDIETLAVTPFTGGVTAP